MEGNGKVISKDYKQNKKDVLELYNKYEKFLESDGKKVENNIKEQAKKIENEIFNLMILGEAKSGKSTFINAYLKKEVVPMDVRQCTSAIIKIRKGNEFKLIAKRVDEKKIEITGDDNIKKFLKDNASISDKWREIPITSINEFLITKKSKRILDKEIKELLNGLAKENIYNININEYDSKIKNYIKENESKWNEIITEIEIIYPLPEEMKGITIIDSPGVGAGGNVGKVAEEYINNANAIIFVKSLSGQAIESSSFMNFFDNNCLNRQKEALFLVFTGKSNLQGYEFKRLKEQAIDMYKTRIEKEKIVFVDSKVQLFLNKCLELGTIEKIDEFFDKLDESGDDFDPVSKRWLKSKGDLNEFKNKMNELSEFEKIPDLLEKFARKANYLQLLSFLNNIEKEYKRLKGIYSSLYDTIKGDIVQPSELEKKINKKKEEIANIYNKMSEGISNILKSYTGIDGTISEKSKKMQENYQKKIDAFCNIQECQINDTTFNNMKKMTFDTIDAIKDFREEMATKIINDCDNKLVKYANSSSQISADAFVPDFTEKEFNSIEAETKKETSGIDEIEKGITFKRVEKVPYYHQKKHVKTVAEDINGRLDGIVSSMKNNIINYCNECINVYGTKLKENKDALNGEYNKLLENKENNDKLISEIKGLETKLSDIAENLSEISNLKKDLTNYIPK